jgi:PKD repeat protein
LYTASNEVGRRCVVFGRGTQRGAAVTVSKQLKGWKWGTSDGVERWGENSVSSVYTDQRVGELLQVRFDRHGTRNECHLSVGDSSGAVFIRDGSTWKLAGIHCSVEGPFSLDGTTNTRFDAALVDMGGLYINGPTNSTYVPDQPFDIPSSFYSTRVSANVSWINGVIATTPVAPVASFAATPTFGAWPLGVTFTDTSTGTLTNRFWSFGDGSTTNTVANILTHTYSVAGANTVSLTVSGPAGASTMTLTNYIVVSDAVAPITPTGLTAMRISASQINLRWNSSTSSGGLGFAGYKVYRDGAQIGTTTATSYADTGLAPNSDYCYTVAAYNNEGETSAPSAQACANTLATPGSLSGTYNGLAIQTNAPLHPSSGNIQLVLSKTGTFAANLTMGGVRSAFKGQFDDSGNTTNTVMRPGPNPLQVVLHLDIDNRTDQITGTVSDGTFTSELLADRVVFSRTNPCPWVGTYTIVLAPPAGNVPAIPQGYGYGTLTVAATGGGKLGGVLADGTKITGNAPVSKHNTWPLYDALYKNQGACIGWVTFDTNDTLEATVDWFRPPMPASHYYPLGFSTNITLIGETYVSPSTGGPSPAGNRQITLGGGNLASNIVKTAVVGDSGNVTVSTPNSENVQLKLQPTTGQFSGSFKHPWLNKTISFKGVLLQLDNSGAGYFLGTNESGYVIFEPPP